MRQMRDWFRNGKNHWIDSITGNRMKIEQRYRKLYDRQDFSEEVRLLKKAASHKYRLVFLFFVILLAVVSIQERVEVDRGIQIKEGRMVAIDRPAEEEGAMKIRAKLDAVGRKESVSQQIQLVIRPEVNLEEEAVALDVKDAEEARKIHLAEEIQTMVKLINKSDSGSEVLLPTQLSDGTRLQWAESQSSKIPALMAGAGACLFFVYRGRYDSLKKEEAIAKESIIRELPEFINKLILLLNAGLVLTAAFSKIIEDYSKTERTVKSYFYQQLIKISRNMRETNSPMLQELKAFAGRSGVKQFMRLMNILSDNVDKGVELVEKLQVESELLWLAKKKLAEEKGRLAESKMTFPLVMLLLVLIMVTVTPALMEM